MSEPDGKAEFLADRDCPIRICESRINFTAEQADTCGKTIGLCLAETMVKLFRQVQDLIDCSFSRISQAKLPLCSSRGSPAKP